MKTSLEIEDSLFKRAKLAAVKHDSTLRELIESGLRRELEALEMKGSERKIDLKPFVIHSGPVDSSMTWDEIRDMIYGIDEAVETYGRR